MKKPEEIAAAILDDCRVTDRELRESLKKKIITAIKNDRCDSNDYMQMRMAELRMMVEAALLDNQ